jgi:signal transduction histidine kinase
MPNLDIKSKTAQFATRNEFASRLWKLPRRVCDWRKRAAILFVFCFAISFGQPAQADNATTGNSSPYPEIVLDDAGPPSTNGLGYWIWAEITRDKQTVRLWKSFEIPARKMAVQAQLRITADNTFKAWLDGHEIGSGSDWHVLNVYDFTGRLKSGTHVLAVEGFNHSEAAGVIVGLQLTLENGRTLQFCSDESWRVVPNSENGWQKVTQASGNWPPATIVGALGKSNLPLQVDHTRELFPGPLPFWQTGKFQFLLFTACGVFVAICLYLLIQLASQSKAHNLIEAERDRIARDIHDDLGSQITQLLLMGELAQISPAMSEPVPRMCESARSILNSIDQVVWIVNSQHDTLDEFVIYVCKFAQSFLASTSIRCRFNIEHDLPKKRLDQLTRRNLFLAVKESLNNVAKHSKATELIVRIEVNGSMLAVILEDNGKGFEDQVVNVERNGICNMNLRMREVGGSCCVTSQTGKGCRVTFSVPLKHTSLLSLSNFLGIKTIPSKMSRSTANPNISTHI